MGSLRAGAVPAFFATLAVPAAGESQTHVVGGNTPPSVRVDQGVIDSLGPPPTLPQLLHGSLRFPEAAPQPASVKPQPARPLRLNIPKPAKKTAKPPVAKPQTVENAVPAPAVAMPTVATPAAPAVATPAPAAPPVEATTPAPSPPTRIGATPAETPKPTPVSAPPSDGGKTETTAAPAKAAEPAGASPMPPPSPNDAAPPSPSSALTRMKGQPTAPESTGSPAGGTTKAASQTAAVPPIPTAGEMRRVAFDGEATALPEDAKAALLDLSRRMLTSDMMRLQLLAYASGDEANASKARRVSLSRALAVRAFLIEQGVASTAIDVRALGNKAADGPLDRVDVVVVPQ